MGTKTCWKDNGTLLLKYGPVPLQPEWRGPNKTTPHAVLPFESIYEVRDAGPRGSIPSFPLGRSSLLDWPLTIG